MSSPKPSLASEASSSVLITNPPALEAIGTTNYVTSPSSVASSSSSKTVSTSISSVNSNNNNNNNDNFIASSISSVVTELIDNIKSSSFAPGTTTTTASTAPISSETSASTWPSIAPPTSPSMIHPASSFHANPKPHSHMQQHASFKPDRLATIDLIIVVVYICLLLSTSISAMIRVRKSRKKQKALMSQGKGSGQAGSSFLSGSRKMNWFTVGTSIFASNLGSEHFIGLSGSAAATGLSVAAFELNALIILQLSSWIFLPVLIVSKISTIPEYMQKRFGGKRIRTYLAVLSILLYIFTKISVNLYSGGIFIQQAVGWNLYTSAMFILALTSVMTLTGGVKGAMMIDNMQAFVMTLGASIVSFKAFVAIGGWDGLKRRYPMAVPSKVPGNLTHCAQPNPLAFQMLRPYNDRDMPWLGFILGQTTASLWYWCADQMLVQRFLSARSLAHVQGSAIFAGYLKTLSLVFMVIPGMISRCLFTDEVSCIDPDECLKFCQSSVSCSNTAYPRLVLELMPMGARGMLVAAMVAALMNDLCNVFNSASALFSCDIWPLFRSRASPKEQETVGKVFVIFLVMASIMWIPVIQEMQGGQLFIYIQAVAGLFVPPITAVYLSAVLWKRTNESGAFWSMMVGFSLAIYRLCLSFMYKEPSCGQTLDERPWILKIHYMYYSVFLFIASTGALVSISLCTKPPAPFRLIRTTFWTRFDTQIRKDDKNVFEMKYTSKTNTNTSSSKTTMTTSSSTKSLLGKPQDRSLSASSSGTMNTQQTLFTIEEQQQLERTKTPDLSSVVVDISSVREVENKQRVNTNKPTRTPLVHQKSLSDAVGAASEAGKFLASKLASEGAKAKDIVLAAATHLKNPTGQSSSGIKFQNLSADDDEDEDDDVTRVLKSRYDDEDDDDELASTNLDGEDEADEDEAAPTSRLQRQKKSRRSGPQSALSAALSSYKRKQQKLRGGYTKTAAFDDEQLDEDEEDEEDDDDDSDLGQNGDATIKGHFNSSNVSAGDESSTDDARQTPTSFNSSKQSQMSLLGSASKKYRASGASHQTTSYNKLNQHLLRNKQSNSSQQQLNSHLSKQQQKRRQRKSQQSASKSQGLPTPINEYEEPEQAFGSNEREFKCLDNTIALLMKSRHEEYFLRLATATIVIMAVGLYIIFSIPPTMPDKQIVDMLKEKF